MSQGLDERPVRGHDIVCGKALDDGDFGQVSCLRDGQDAVLKDVR